MHYGTALLIAASLLASSAPAAEPQPAGSGVWQGTVGSAPVRACFDGKSGSYYYLSRLTPIPLSFDNSRWTEGNDGKPTAPALVFDRIASTRIEGHWVGGGKSLALTLDRVAIKRSPDDMGPCGSIEYLAPRLGPTPLHQTRGTIDGVQYGKLVLVIPGSFKNASVESFALQGGTPAILRVNQVLAKPLSAKTAAEGWIWCMLSQLSQNGEDGYYAEELTPTMIGRRYLSANHHNDGSCGGAHPYSDNHSRTFDLSSGAEIDLNDWLTPRAIKRERYDSTSDEAKTVTPAFRKFILAGWKAEQAECREGIERADFWDIALTRTGFGFTPSLAHVEQACTETIAVPFTRLQPWLSATGKAGIVRR